MLFIHKKGMTNDMCYNMTESCKHAKGNKLATQEYILYDSITQNEQGK